MADSLCLGPSTAAIVNALQDHVAEVVVANPLQVRLIAEARVKAEVLAVELERLTPLLPAGELDMSKEIVTEIAAGSVREFTVEPEAAGVRRQGLEGWPRELLVVAQLEELRGGEEVLHRRGRLPIHAQREAARPGGVEVLPGRDGGEQASAVTVTLTVDFVDSARPDVSTMMCSGRLGCAMAVPPRRRRRRPPDRRAARG